MIMNNTNTTLENCVNNSNYDTSLRISNIIWHVSGIISIIAGIPGHIFQIIILSYKTNQKDPTSLYFIAIAICELIFLLGLFWLWCANISFIKTDPRQVLSCGIFYTILIGSTTLSNLYLASLAIDRSLMILRPTRYHLLVTRSRVILRIIVIYILILFLLIPHHFYFYYDARTTLFICDFHSSVNHQQIRLWSLIHAILFVSIPSLIVCISSFILLHNRCKHKRIYKKNLSESARRMHRRSIFIFFFSIGIFLSLLPSCILEIFIVHERFFDHEIYCSIRWKIYKILLNCFLTLSSINYSIKFYIHLIISSSFRKSFIRFISCKSNQNISEPSRIHSGNHHEEHLLPPMDLNKAKLEEI